MELAELIAREQIRDTVARYNQAGDAGRFEEMVACFAPDGRITVAGEAAHVGAAALMAFFSGIRSERALPRDLTCLRHCVTNLLIEVYSDTEAAATSYFQVITDIGLDHWGRYRDRLVPIGDRWLLAERSVKTDGYAEGSLFQQ